MRNTLLLSILALASMASRAELPDPFADIGAGLSKVGDKKVIKSVMRVRDQPSCFQLVMTVEKTGEIPHQGALLPVVKTSSACTPVTCPAESEIQIVKGYACESIAPVAPVTVTTIYTGKIDPSKIVAPKTSGPASQPAKTGG